MSADDLDARIDALYAGPPGEFTAARNALAKALKEQGEAGEASRVAALKRPTKLAAALNRLARDRPDAVASLLDAEEALAGAQGALLDGSGDAAALDEAVRAEEQAVAALASDPTVAAALRVAARREEERDDLRRGRLGADPKPDLGSGFGLGGAPPPRPARDDPRDEVAARRRAKDARERRQGAVAEARELAAAAAR
ncbi:MAG TPA: hypothetical protein VFG74_00270, partial [Miltoncostaeaceae bacterium]|nr:hypothetical protein [Miltoncostaeaceae bacterium]